MITFSPQLHRDSSVSLYKQLYEYIRQNILDGSIAAGERLPSLRSLSKDLEISITTTEAAYSQLLIEGYLVNRPQSGYYVAELEAVGRARAASEDRFDFDTYPFETGRYLYDLSSFDFVKWKKCMARVLNDHPELLLWESDPQGEGVLRQQISRYLYSSRGVSSSPDQVVISAGIQQLTGHLSRIMKQMGISHVSTEDPGYAPVRNMFQDQGMVVTPIPVADDGIVIEKLPVNIPSAVYVSPSSQFPTGCVMPIGRRYKLLEWAKSNGSIILEDDYDSELRYFGKPIPALSGLDEHGSVVYFGSFSSTLFPAIKISYMVLPKQMAEIFHVLKVNYDQTCSKEEQLTLAMFMEQGHYKTGIKKLRSLYSRKLDEVISSFEKYAPEKVSLLSERSGINVTLQVRTRRTPEELTDLAESLSLRMQPLPYSPGEGTCGLIFYYNQIPLEKIEGSIRDLTDLW